MNDSVLFFISLKCVFILFRLKYKNIHFLSKLCIETKLFSDFGIVCESEFRFCIFPLLPSWFFPDLFWNWKDFSLEIEAFRLNYSQILTLFVCDSECNFVLFPICDFFMGLSRLLQNGDKVWSLDIILWIWKFYI